MASKPTPSSPLLRVPEVADRLGLSTKTIWRLIDGGELHRHRIGRAVRVSEEDLAAYLKSCRR